MPITIKSGKTAHEEAAEQLHTGQKTTTITKTEKAPGQKEKLADTSVESEPVAPAAKPYHYLNFGMNFKFPLLDFHMVGYDVGVSVPFHPDERSIEDVFEENAKWVDEKINKLVAEQQEAMEKLKAEQG